MKIIFRSVVIYFLNTANIILSHIFLCNLKATISRYVYKKEFLVFVENFRGGGGYSNTVRCIYSILFGFINLKVIILFKKKKGMGNVLTKRQCKNKFAKWHSDNLCFKYALSSGSLIGAVGVKIKTSIEANDQTCNDDKSVG